MPAGCKEREIGSGVDLPFDRGKHDGGHSMEGDGIRAEGEFFVLLD